MNDRPIWFLISDLGNQSNKCLEKIDDGQAVFN